MRNVYILAYVNGYLNFTGIEYVAFGTNRSTNQSLISASSFFF